MTNEEDRAWEMMRSIGYCSLVTKSAGSGLRARPMTAITRKEECRVYIFAGKSEAAIKEIASNADVLLTFSTGPSQNVCLNGTASVVSDRSLIERLWSPGAQAYFPNGPKDPEITVIVVNPGACEYWDGPNKAVMVAKMAYALATGGMPDLGDKRKVSL